MYGYESKQGTIGSAAWREIQKCRNVKMQKYRNTKSLGKELLRCGSMIETMGSVAWREI